MIALPIDLTRRLFAWLDGDSLSPTSTGFEPTGYSEPELQQAAALIIVEGLLRSMSITAPDREQERIDRVRSAICERMLAAHRNASRFNRQPFGQHPTCLPLRRLRARGRRRCAREAVLDD